MYCISYIARHNLFVLTIVNISSDGPIENEGTLKVLQDIAQLCIFATRNFMLQHIIAVMLKIILYYWILCISVPPELVASRFHASLDPRLSRYLGLLRPRSQDPSDDGSVFLFSLFFSFSDIVYLNSSTKSSKSSLSHFDVSFERFNLFNINK